MNKQTFRAADGFEIAYYVDDNTDPWTQPDVMLMMHPAMGNSRRWFRWVPRLSRHFRVVRMDLRGHGASQKPKPDEPFSLDQLVGDAAKLIEVVGGGSAHVVGNSAGGYVAQKLAIGQPDKVKTLALYGATPGLKNSKAASWIPRIREIGLKKFIADTIHERFDEKADPALVAWFIEQTGSNDPEFIGRFVLHMTTHEFMDELSAIRCPTLIVAAGHEPIGDGGAYAKMHERIRGSKLVQLDAASHNIGDQYADRCCDELLKFLGKDPAAR